MYPTMIKLILLPIDVACLAYLLYRAKVYSESGWLPIIAVAFILLCVGWAIP